MWRIPGGDCKLLPGGGVKTDCGLILPDGMHVIYSCWIISYCTEYCPGHSDWQLPTFQKNVLPVSVGLKEVSLRKLSGKQNGS